MAKVFVRKLWKGKGLSGFQGQLLQKSVSRSWRHSWKMLSIWCGSGSVGEGVQEWKSKVYVTTNVEIMTGITLFI